MKSNSNGYQFYKKRDTKYNERQRNRSAYYCID